MERRKIGSPSVWIVGLACNNFGGRAGCAAAPRGRSLLELAISWLAANPQMTSVIQKGL